MDPEAPDFFVIVDREGQRLLLVRTNPPGVEVIPAEDIQRALRVVSRDAPGDLLDQGLLLANTNPDYRAAIEEAQRILIDGAPTGHVALSGSDPLTFAVARMIR